MQLQAKRWPYVACVIVLTMIFGTGNAVTKFAYASITPFWCMAIRFALATAVFFIAFGPRIVRQLRRVKLRLWVPLALCEALGYISCNLALAHTTAMNTGFLVGLPVIFAPIIGIFVLHRRYPVAMIPFQVLVVGGLYLLCCNGGAFSFGVGELLALSCSIFLGASLVLAEAALDELDAIAIAGTQIAAAFALSLVGALVLEAPPVLADVQPVAWAVIVYMALFSTCLTFLLQNFSLTNLPSSLVSLLLTGEPVFTALFSWLLLGERLTGAGWVGAALIFVSIVGATYFEGKSADSDKVAEAADSTAASKPAGGSGKVAAVANAASESADAIGG